MEVGLPGTVKNILCHDSLSWVMRIPLLYVDETTSPRRGYVCRGECGGISGHEWCFTEYSMSFPGDQAQLLGRMRARFLYLGGGLVDC